MMSPRARPADTATPEPGLAAAPGRPRAVAGSGWQARAALAGLVVAAGLLAGCNLPASQPRELPTASDQGEAERRARVRLELASAYFGNRRFDTALDEVKLALQIYPDLPEAYGLRGLIYAAMGEQQLAEASFRRALAMRPKDGELLHNVGWFECQRRRFDVAMQRFDEALLLPQYREVARTQLARGVCLARSGRLEEAEGALMRSYELNPSDIATGFNLAEVLYRRQAYERARFYIHRVNGVPDAANAQTLWLEMRIERRLGQETTVRVLGEQLRARFPQSPEATLFDRGRFDD